MEHTENKVEGLPPLGTFLTNFKTTQDIEINFFCFNFVSLKVILHTLIVLIVLRYSPGNLLVFNRAGKGRGKKLIDFGLRRAKLSRGADSVPLSGFFIYQW